MRRHSQAAKQETPQVAEPSAVPIGVRLLLLSCVKERTGLSRATLYRHASAGILPKIIRVGGRSGMLEHELDAALLALGEEGGAVR